MFRPQIALAAILLLPVAAPAQTSQWQQDQKTESQVQQAVSVTGLPSIQSSVKNGVVTLTGTVHTEEDKARVSQSLVNVPGIKMVMNNLTIGRPAQAVAPAKATMLAAGTASPFHALHGFVISTVLCS